MNIILQRFRETLVSVSPIILIVIALHLTLVPLSGQVLSVFFIGSGLIVFGLTLFIMGVDVGLTPIGNKLGSAVARSGKLWLVIAVGFVLGVIITVAEPSLIILANQIEFVTSSVISAWTIVAVVSLGIAVLLTVGLLRIVYAWGLKTVLVVLYGIILVISLISPPDFLPIAFDSSGATTGALAVPFILAIALGTSSMRRDSRKGEDDSFGLVGVASTGAIITVLLLGSFSNIGRLSSGSNALADLASKEFVGGFSPFISAFGSQFTEVLVALTPILLVFIIANRASFKLSKIEFARIFVGLILSFIGLVLFLLGVNEGFMEVGKLVGAGLTSAGNTPVLVAVAFALGLVTILAEPAVLILTKQIEDSTSGYVKRSLVLITLAVGVGLAVALAVLRVLIPALQLWHILLPGYIIAVALTFFTPNLFIGIAFDSGGVASGPMTATFVLAFMQGIAGNTPGADIVLDGFGVISMVAMIPLIALQLLGVMFKIKTRKINLEGESNAK